MELNPAQTDALTELITIGYGRAAGALSELTGHRIELEVPRITMHPIDEIAPRLGRLITQGEVATVNQAFSGPIFGNALLVLDEKSATLLGHLLSDDKTMPTGFNPAGREMVTEIGNILLNACLGVFGNVLQVRVSFSVPRLQVASIGQVLKKIASESEELQHGLMIHMQFRLRNSSVSGYLVIILGIASLDRMLAELEKWELRQIA